MEWQRSSTYVYWDTLTIGQRGNYHIEAEQLEKDSLWTKPLNPTVCRGKLHWRCSVVFPLCCTHRTPSQLFPRCPLLSFSPISTRIACSQPRNTSPACLASYIQSFSPICTRIAYIHPQKMFCWICSTAFLQHPNTFVSHWIVFTLHVLTLKTHSVCRIQTLSTFSYSIIVAFESYSLLVPPAACLQGAVSGRMVPN